MMGLGGALMDWGVEEIFGFEGFGNEGMGVLTDSLELFSQHGFIHESKFSQT